MRFSLAKVSKKWKLQPIYHHKYNMQSNDGSSCKKTMQRVNPRAKVNYITGYVSIDKNKKIQGVTAWETKQIYNKFVPVSISRNCYVCHATYRSDTKQFSIAFEDITNNNDDELLLFKAENAVHSAIGGNLSHEFIYAANHDPNSIIYK